MSHEEWMLHQHFEYTMKLLEYVETRILDKDFKTGEYLHEALMDLGTHIGLEIDKFAR